MRLVLPCESMNYVSYRQLITHSKAVRYNILVNPSGQDGKSRGVDWLVELNNLFTKVTAHCQQYTCTHNHLNQDKNGGSGSNYTKERVIEESPLTNVYRDAQKKMERELHLPATTSAQAEKNMTKTFRKLLEYTSEKEPNTFKPGRTVRYQVPDVLNKGQSAYAKVKGRLIQVDAEDDFEGIDLELDDFFDDFGEFL